MKTFLAALALLMFVGLQGCASVTKGTKDTIQVQVSNCSEPMDCTATNKKGSWTFTAPGSVTFKKSDNDLTIACVDGSDVITQSLRPTRGGMIWGNVLIGGIIGGGVDAITDAHWNMADSLVLHRNNCSEQRVALADQNMKGGQTETQSQTMQGCIDLCVANTSRSPETCFDICIEKMDPLTTSFKAPTQVQPQPQSRMEEDVRPSIQDNGRSANEGLENKSNQTSPTSSLTESEKQADDAGGGKPAGSQENSEVTQRLNGVKITCTTIENVTECK